MLPLPQPEDSLNVRVLARVEREDFTGITGTVVTLSQDPIEAAAAPGTSQYVFCWKNGLLVHNIAGADYTIAGKVVTLAAALVGTDKLSVFYWARGS